jgi:hypothetical protein
MKRNMARPISARPRRGPITAPAIHALLLLLLVVPLPSVPTEIAEALAPGELVEVTAAEIRLGTGSARRDVSGDTKSRSQESGSYTSRNMPTRRSHRGSSWCLTIITPIQR